MYLHVQFANRLMAAGVELPDQAREAVELWSAAVNVKAPDPIGELRRSVQAGELTPEQLPAAMRETAAARLAGEQLHGLVAELDHPCTVRFAGGITGNADRIVGQLRERFDPAVEQLAAAVGAVPVSATADQVLALGAVAAEGWQAISAATAVLEEIRALRTEMSRVYGYPPATPPVAAFLAPVAHPDLLTRADFAWRGKAISGRIGSGIAYDLPEVHGGVWRHLLDLGCTLRLNTATEAARVVQRTAPAVVR